MVEATPWHVEEFAELAGAVPADGPMYVFDMLDEDRRHIARIIPTDGEGNHVAKLIIRAVNAHDDLLAAAKKVLMRNMHFETCDWYGCTYGIRKLEIAVTKAEGGQQ